MKEITQTQKLLDTINMHGPIRTGKLEELTKVPAKNHSGLLAGRIAMGHVIVAKVQENINGRMRSVTEYKIGAAYTSKAAERVAQIDHAKKKAPAPFRRDEVPAVREAQPAVADNTGSASLVVHSSQGGAQSIQDEATVKESLPVEPGPIIYTASNASIVGELAQALDRIAELKEENAKLTANYAWNDAELQKQGAYIAELQAENARLKQRMHDRGIDLEPHEMIAALEKLLPIDWRLVIQNTELPVLVNQHDEEFQIKPDEIYAFFEAIKFIDERMVA